MSVDPSRYAELFRTESREQLSAINRALLSLEEEHGGTNAVAEIFRAVHTVKGMSATMGYKAVAEFAHELESLLDRLRRGEQRPSPDVMDALFAAADALEGGIDEASELATQTPAMAAALQRLHDAAGGRATSEFAVVELDADGKVTAAAPDRDALDGPGVIVRVRQAPETILPGVRVFMVVQRVRGLGEVAAVSPPMETLQGADTAQAFAMRVITDASPEDLTAAVRSVGDIAHVEVDLRGRAKRRSEPAAGVAAVAAVAAVPGKAERAVPAPAAGSAASRAVKHVRIDLARLDMLMNLIGELVIARSRLIQLTQAMGDPAIDETMQTAARLIGDLQSEIMTSRMVPVWQVFDRFPRLVRDAARALEKEVTLEVEGRDIELDRSLLDEIGEPVVHLLRNAVDHGLEMPADRVKAGKPRAGRLVLAAARDKAAILVRVSDDGKGIDRAKVLEKARASGLVEVTVKELDDEQLLRCIAQPGFSTADQVSGISGRGVGVDAVLSKVRSLGGSLEMKTVRGEGTTITMRLPVTLAIVKALVARAGAERFALPLTHVRETVEFGAGTVQRVQGKDVLVLRDEVLPLLDLRDVVRLGGLNPQLRGADDHREIVVIERGDKRSGLVVDELLGQQEIVVKQFDPAKDALTLFSGATILPDGAPALIMDVASLI